MSLPNNQASTGANVARYISPYDRIKLPLEDYEYGGIALNDGSQGLEVQVWHLVYDGEETSPTYGNFTVIPETTGAPVVVINVPNVISCCLAFNQNMDIFIGYELRNNGGAKYYWWDPTLPGYTTTTLTAGSKSLQCCMDDHRAQMTQQGTNDIILGYMRSGTLYYRQQRDRYLTERSLGTGLGSAKLLRVGMTENNRLWFMVRRGAGTRLSDIVSDLCMLVKETHIDVRDLYPIKVRGFLTSGSYTSADAIRSLQPTYFFDFPEIDGKLVAVPRGGDTIVDIPYDDIVIGDDIAIESAREQGLEFPKKLHLAYASAETDYTPTKETSERRSPDVRVVGEAGIDTSVNFVSTEAAQRIDAMHKVYWAEQEGSIKFGVDESYAYLVPSDLVRIEIRTGQWKRVRIQQNMFGDGYFKLETVIDRKSAYSSLVTGSTRVTPTSPPPTISSLTTWEFLDIPTLFTTSEVGLVYYVVGSGDQTTAWSGARLQRLVGADYQAEADILLNATMGVLAATLADAPAEYTDVTNTTLVTTNNPLYTTTRDLILQGANLALVDDEIIQFQTAVDESGNWRISTLERGRLNTATVAHSIGARFILLSGGVVAVPASPSLVGTTLTLRAPSYGEQPSTGIPGDYVFTGESQREWPPTHLVSTFAANIWTFSWRPRARLGSSAHPIVSLYFLGWRITFDIGGAPVIYDFADTTMSNPNFTYTEAMQIADFGSAQATLNVTIYGRNSYTGLGDSLYGVET